MSKPEWLKIDLPNKEYYKTKEVLDYVGVNTVCREAKCPNVNECWGKKTATFMILGDVCTRGCKFCNTKKGRVGKAVDFEEAERIVTATKLLGLKYVVITSVDRDDLQDLGAGHFAMCIKKIKTETDAYIEVLTPDFQGKNELIIIDCITLWISN
ncbi:MAG: radical SAM protein, partial [Candidatus Micrarchaeia archaeon]